MDCFAMLWMFDARWLFGIRPVLYEHLLLFPIIMNLVVIGTTVNDRVKRTCLPYSSSLIEVLILSSLITALVIGMYIYLVIRRNKVTRELK
jgi:hypothetical protein